MDQEIITRAYTMFHADAAAVPAITLRGGEAIDRYASPPPYAPEIDQPTDNYLERYAWGITYLDPASWRHYLPRLIDYALRHKEEGPFVIDSLLASLRPPEREPPRFAVLTKEQEEVIGAFLEMLAFDEGSVWQDQAMQVLEEYWIPGALYRREPSRNA
jgi:hypothetical protein